MTDDSAAAESGGGWSESGLQAPWRPRRRRRLLVVLALVLVCIWWFVPPVYKLLHGPVVVTRYGKTFGEVKATVGPGLKNWISIKKVSKHALHAILAEEDGKFYEHHGLDFEAIRKSYEINKKKKRYARGGSTISQQVVKMAFLGREKTLVRKAREAVGTILMELLLPKDKILEWYINLAEFGDNIYGLHEAAWHYFKTKPELLTVEQSVHLAMVLPSPNAWSRGLRNRRLTAFGHRRYAAVLNTMRGMGYVTKAQWLAAITRGDFGRPIAGYAQLIADEESHKLCPGSPGCPETDEADTVDEDVDELSYPQPANQTPAAAAPATGVQSTGPTAPGTAPAEAPAGAAGTTPATTPAAGAPEAGAKTAPAASPATTPSTSPVASPAASSSAPPPNQAPAAASPAGVQAPAAGTPADKTEDEEFVP